MITDKYKKYKRKMGRIVKFFRWVNRYKIAILSVIGAMFLTSSAALAVNGVVYDTVDCPLIVQ